MTTVSTMGAAVMTPLLSTALAGRYVPIDGVGLALSTVQLVLIPTILGLMLNEYARKQVDVIRPIMPFVALFLTLNVASIIESAQTTDQLLVFYAGKSCGMELFPDFGKLFCVHDLGNFDSPFGSGVWVISLGFLLTLSVVLPLSFLNLDENIIVQKT